MTADWIFDKEHYHALNVAREAVVKRLLVEQFAPLNLKSAIDVGCGVGHFSNLLSSLGLRVTGVDAREENILEARSRFPDIEFSVADAEHCGVEQFGQFDLVLCFGLLYHLENPFRVIRNLVGMSSRLALLEGMVYPSPEPIMSLLDENICNDQGVNYVAFYPSEACMAKMLVRSGLVNCYVPSPMPDHPNYQFQKNGFRIRSMMAASREPIAGSTLAPYSDVTPGRTPWTMPSLYTPKGVWGRIHGFISRTLQHRINANRT